MRRRLRWLAVALLGLAPAAEAAVVPFEATLSLKFSTIPPIVFMGGGLATLNGSGGTGHLATFELPGGAISGVVSIPLTDPAVSPLHGVLASASNGPGSFALGGVMPLAGAVTICLFGACNGGSMANVGIPFTRNGTRGIGIGGGPIVETGALRVTVLGAPWTTGQTTVDLPFFPIATGFVHGPASGGASSAAQASGAVRLVSPVVVNTNIGSSPALPIIATLDLRFVPEPTTLALVAAGSAGLAVAGRRRLARSAGD